jgi:hypothetical protein
MIATFYTMPGGVAVSSLSAKGRRQRGTLIPIRAQTKYAFPVWRRSSRQTGSLRSSFAELEKRDDLLDDDTWLRPPQRVETLRQIVPALCQLLDADGTLAWLAKHNPNLRYGRPLDLPGTADGCQTVIGECSDLVTGTFTGSSAIAWLRGPPWCRPPWSGSDKGITVD